MSLDLSDWKNKCTIVSLIYFALELGYEFSVNPEGDDKFIEPFLQECFNKGLLDIDSNKLIFVPTEKGKGLQASIVEMVNKILPYEIFSDVDITRQLSSEEFDDQNPNLIASNLFDPRFAETDNSVDMRMAIINWLNEYYSKNNPIDPREVVFLQRLGSGELRSDSFWFDLRIGNIFKDIENIVNSAYKWTDVSYDKDHSNEIMGIIYTSGMLELKKRSGNKCGKCNMPLAIFEEYANETGGLKECPNPDCKASFEEVTPIQVSQSVCPNCNSFICHGQTNCNGCGSMIDFSLPQGTVSTETTKYVESYWSHPSYYYGVAPLYYYDPWDPFIATIAIGIYLW